MTQPHLLNCSPGDTRPMDVVEMKLLSGSAKNSCLSLRYQTIGRTQRPGVPANTNTCVLGSSVYADVFLHVACRNADATLHTGE